jgi:peptide/nickel transport system substrate-binding protein
MPRARSPLATPCCALAAFVLLAMLPSGAVVAQRGVPGAVVIIIGRDPVTPLPMLTRSTADLDVSNQLFLRLARIAPGLRTWGDSGFAPELARRWSRRDSVTLAFDLDARARWHDGRPVVANDVVTTLDRARDPATGGRYAALLSEVAEVRAEGPRRVVIRFRRPYSEQFYDAVYHVPPLPAHLVAAIPADSLAGSRFAREPVGNGPYRWVRSEPGQLVELEAVRGHFLGTPGIRRVVFRVVPDADARLNLLLSRDGDAQEAVSPPVANLERIRAAGHLREVPVASGLLGYVLFNFADPTDSTRARPHPILGDVRVRRALVQALDRTRMVRSVFGPYAAVPEGPTSQLWWIRSLAPAALPVDTATARRLLAEAGWRDTDGDGVLDRDGRPLVLRFNVPAPSPPRRLIALQIQEQLRPLGVQLDVQVVEGAVFTQRRNRGDFDLDFGGAVQDPSPSGIVNSWSCANAGMPDANVGRYCDPAVDSLVNAARFASGDPSPHWRQVLARIQADAPAIFLYAPATVFAVSTRYRDATLRPDSPWGDLRRWHVDPARALPRDRATR